MLLSCGTDRGAPGHIQLLSGESLIGFRVRDQDVLSTEHAGEPSVRLLARQDRTCAAHVKGRECHPDQGVPKLGLENNIDWTKWPSIQVTEGVALLEVPATKKHARNARKGEPALYKSVDSSNHSLKRTLISS